MGCPVEARREARTDRNDPGRRRVRSEAGHGLDAEAGSIVLNSRYDNTLRLARFGS